LSAVLFAAALIVPAGSLVANVGTAITYQGQLKQFGGALNGTADFEFTLWDAESDGGQGGTLAAVNGVNSADG